MVPKGAKNLFCPFMRLRCNFVTFIVVVLPGQEHDGADG